MKNLRFSNTALEFYTYDFWHHGKVFFGDDTCDDMRRMDVYAKIANVSKPKFNFGPFY